MNPDGNSDQKPYYRNLFLRSHQEKLKEIGLAGGTHEINKLMSRVYTTLNNAIDSTDIHHLNPFTIARDILIPRQELYFFVLTNWVKYVFIPSLNPRFADSLLIFGIGRIFSLYNDTGIQYCSDADLNFVVRNTVQDDGIVEIKKAVEILRKTILEKFNIIIESKPGFIIRTEQEIHDKLSSSDPHERMETILFYKSNESSLFVLHDNPMLHESIFSKIRQYPDSMLFTHYLGDNTSKPTITRIRAGRTKLPILVDQNKQTAMVSSVIGSKSFKINARRLALVHPDLYPGEWYFSIKYTVNRVYDYVSALLHQDYSLTEIGFTGVDDPDYRFICNTHALMLYLQELTHIKLDSFNDELSDHSYMSSQRFVLFIQVGGDGFYRVFENMIIKGGLLLLRQQKQYIHLKSCILLNNRDRVVESTDKEIESLISSNKLNYELEHHGYSTMKIRIPYSWADLGYFVFDTITERMISVVADKFLPSLAGLGMTGREIALYREMLRINVECRIND
jgi:hypothetical protein